MVVYPSYRRYVVRLKPWQNLQDMRICIGIAFHGVLVGSTSRGETYWALPRPFNGQFESWMKGRLPPFEGVDFIEEVEL
jgi:hypothetical protein